MTAGGALAFLAQQYRRHGDLETGHFSTTFPSAQPACAREPTHPLLRRFYPAAGADVASPVAMFEGFANFANADLGSVAERSGT